MRWILRVCLVVTLCLPAWANAQQAGDVQLPEGADVRIIVDISGSMKDNDPDNLRQPAVRLLARMLPEDAYAGLWTFGQYVNMLVPRDRVDDSWRERMINRSSEISSVALRTNLGEAIEVASDDYFTDGDLSNTDFILLTDGKVDISDNDRENQAERERILGPLLEGLVAKGATFHTVALSAEADVGLLETLTRETRGSHSIAPSADALNRAFLKALNAAVPQEQVPIEGNRFSVDSGVQEFTALIFWGEDETRDTRELQLTDPDGNASVVGNPGDTMRWARESGYDLITVTDPKAGEWRLNGELGEGSRVTVVSDLRMVVNPVPPAFSEEEPLALRIAFFEDQDKLTDPDFLDVIDVRVTITSEDDRSGTKVLSGDQPPENGVYRDTIGRMPSPGEYVIDVVADGQTFSRKFTGISRFDVAEDQGSSVPPDEPAVTQPVATVQEDAPDSAAESEQEPAHPPQPEPEPAEDNASAGPVDISAVEEPRADPGEPKESDPAVPLWAMLAGGIVVILIVAGGVYAVVRRKRKAAPATDSKTDTEDKDGEESQDDEEVPVVEPEPEPEPEPESKPEPEPQEEIPVASTEVDDEESSEEFGLEDFDLSEFDDLPDTEDGDDPESPPAGGDKPKDEEERKP